MECDPTEECDFFPNELENDKNVSASDDLMNALPNENPNIPVSVLPNEINYYSEVKCIMYAFGDVNNPLKSSVKLMHQLLQDQMDLLIKKAKDVMLLRNGKNIDHTDILFLMRKNKVLLKRLLQFLFVEDAKSCLLRDREKYGGEFKPENGKRVSQCLKYFAFIEKFTGDLTSILSNESIVDHVYMKRLKRRNLMTESMTKEEYQSFFEYTLKMTFCHKNDSVRFKSWLQQCSCTKTDITPLALSILHFLARETIAGIVDKALEIKSRKYNMNDNFQLEDFNNPVDMCCESEQNLDDLETNLQSCLSEASDKSSENENYILEDPSINAKLGNKVPQSNAIKVCNGVQAKVIASKLSHLDQNRSSSCPKNESVVSTSKRKSSVSSLLPNKNLNDNARKRKKKYDIRDNFKLDDKYTRKNNTNENESSIMKIDQVIDDVIRQYCDTSEEIDEESCFSLTNHDICDNSKLDNKYLDTNNTNENESSIMKIDQVIDDVIRQYCDTSEEIDEESCFYMNFKEKTLSICYNSSETFEISTNSDPSSDTFSETKIKDLAATGIEEYIDEFQLENFKTKDSISPLLNNFVKHIGHNPFSAPMKVDYKVHWFPNKAITPAEIQAAFIWYQHPSPLSSLMKTKLFKMPPRETNLVCLANPDDLV